MNKEETTSPTTTAKIDRTSATFIKNVISVVMEETRVQEAEQMVRAWESTPEARRAAIEQFAHLCEMYRQFSAQPDIPLDLVPDLPGAGADDEDPAATLVQYQANMPEGQMLPTISTITMTSGVGTRVNLSLMYEKAREMNRVGAVHGHRILNLRYGNQPMLGAWPVVRARRPKKAAPKNFFCNQATMDIQLASDSNRFVSCKLFENGKAQLSGSKSVHDARDVVAVLVEFLKDLQTYEDNGGSIQLKMIPVVASAFEHMLQDPFWTPDRRWRFLLRVRTKRYGTQIQRFCVLTPFAHMRKLVYRPENLRPMPVQVEMINSDFQSAQMIDRHKLSRLIHTEYPAIKYRYDPSMYSGVILRVPCSHHCTHGCSTLEAKRLCAKNASKTKDRASCHEITVICFHEGVVILTGARSYHMVYEGYRFIRTLYETRKNDIALQVPQEPVTRIAVSMDDLRLI